MKKQTTKQGIVLVAVILLVCVTAGAICTAVKMTRPVNDRVFSMIDAWAIAWTADQLGDEAMKKTLRKRLKQIKYVELTEFRDGVVPYIGICRSLSLPIDEEKVLTCLRTWYVPEQRLFTFQSYWVYDGVVPDVESDLGATLMLLREYPEVLQWDDEFHLREGILDGVQAFPYLMPEAGKTEHMSGGLCVWLVGLLSETDGKDYTWALPENIRDWYLAWEEHLAANGTSDAMDRTRWEVCRALHQPVSSAVADAQSQYDNLRESDAAKLNSTLLLISLRQIWSIIDTSSNPAFLDALKERVGEMVRDFSFRKIP